MFCLFCLDGALSSGNRFQTQQRTPKGRFGGATIRGSNCPRKAGRARRDLRPSEFAASTPPILSCGSCCRKIAAIGREASYCGPPGSKLSMRLVSSRFPDDNTDLNALLRRRCRYGILVFSRPRLSPAFVCWWYCCTLYIYSAQAKSHPLKTAALAGRLSGTWSGRTQNL